MWYSLVAALAGQMSRGQLQEKPGLGDQARLAG